ncbi:MAG: AAA family ATPase, partial [Deltaproteobacteria bacterium]|nr:AAA family ATPase [Deltaproteobacteria bacterium]
MRQTIRDFAKKELPDNTLLITCGLPASGKTITSQMIAKEKGFQVLRTDTIRLDVLKNEDVFDQKTASDMNKRMAVYNEMFKRAGKRAEKGGEIIFDPTFFP